VQSQYIEPFSSTEIKLDPHYLMKRTPYALPRSSRLLAVIVILAVVSWQTDRALACACCSDPGTRREAVEKVKDYHRDQIHGLEFDPNAELYMTDAGEGEVKGISAIANTYRLTVTLDDKQWRFTFRTEDGKTGVLTLPIPAKLGVFQVDPRDGRKSAGGGPLLYKEWRWEGVPKAEGIFQKGAQRYSLVFQGHGNRCDNGSDFSHWRLEVTGKNVSYALFGAFAREWAKEEKAAE
jgi:hypothetical protein